ncbi:MAG: hypothetical protein KUG68_09725 [Flavobacteriaceae bacterium]|nr:hypothetical protein [Flavobacteriaceae bacterium]
MKIKFLIGVLMVTFLMYSCKEESKDKEPETTETKVEETKFNYNVEQFADIKVLRYEIGGWDQLTLKEQKLAYYLTQAGLSGRDIMWDQNYRHNLEIRTALEKVYSDFKGDKTSSDWASFETYLKRVWFSN